MQELDSEGERSSEPPPLLIKTDRAPPLVRDVFEAKGYEDVDEEDERFDTCAYHVYWKCSRFKPSEYTAANALQRVNHFPKTTGITKKDCLLRNLRRMRSNHGAIYAFFPESYVLPNEYMTLARQCEEKKSKGESKPIWILKPTDSSQGRKIFIIRDLSEISYGHFSESIANAKEDGSQLFGPEELPGPTWRLGSSSGGGGRLGSSSSAARPWEKAEDLVDHKGRAIATEIDMSTTLRMLKSRLHKTVTPCVKFTEAHICQRYLERPLCFHGYKLDLRIYVLIASAQPLRLYWFRDCLVRFATQKYDLADLDNSYSHLTNTSINKNSTSYSTVKEGVKGGCKWSLLTFNREYPDHPLGSPLLWARIKAIVTLTMLSIAADIPDNGGGFELLGYDVMIDEQLKPWLLEVNCSPALGVECNADREVKEPLIGDLCDLLAKQRALNESKAPAGNGLRAVAAAKARGWPSGKRGGGGGAAAGSGGDSSSAKKKSGGGGEPQPSTLPDQVGGYELIFPFNAATTRLSQRVAGSEGSIVAEVRADLQRVTAAASASAAAADGEYGGEEMAGVT